MAGVLKTAIIPAIIAPIKEEENLVFIKASNIKTITFKKVPSPVIRINIKLKKNIQPVKAFLMYNSDLSIFSLTYLFNIIVFRRGGDC
jgi:hypothetical protein